MGRQPHEGFYLNHSKLGSVIQEPMDAIRNKFYLGDCLDLRLNAGKPQEWKGMDRRERNEEPR